MLNLHTHTYTHTNIYSVSVRKEFNPSLFAYRTVRTDEEVLKSDTQERTFKISGAADDL